MTRATKNDITNKRFGRYVALKFVPDDTSYSKWLCRCDCGVTRVVMAQALLSGNTRSCGCLCKEINLKRIVKHGEAGSNRSGTYQSWAGMMDRCEWGGHPSYANYGAKGIRVCPRWHDYRNFLADMGPRPPKLSIDRINGALGYSPENCRWATNREQSLNKRGTKRVLYQGRVVAVADLCNMLGLSVGAIYSRAFRRGKDYVSALASLGINVSLP